MFVYVIFSAYAGLKNLTEYRFEDVADDINTAREMTKNMIVDVYEISTIVENDDFVHSDMDENNNYTFVGSRKACKQNCYCRFGGFVIEKFEVKGEY